jgi:hypothetical protein
MIGSLPATFDARLATSIHRPDAAAEAAQPVGILDGIPILGGVPKAFEKPRKIEG